MTSKYRYHIAPLLKVQETLLVATDWYDSLPIQYPSTQLVEQ